MVVVGGAIKEEGAVRWSSERVASEVGGRGDGCRWFVFWEREDTNRQFRGGGGERALFQFFSSDG